MTIVPADDARNASLLAMSTSVKKRKEKKHEDRRVRATWHGDRIRAKVYNSNFTGK